MPEPPQLAPLDVGSSGSTPSSSQMAELLTLSLRWCPATLRKKLILAACNRDLLLLVMTPKFMAIGEGTIGGKSRASLFGSALSSPQRTSTASPLLRQLHRSVY
ncbi:hypothetical protein AMECASPLE_033597 [Ameca splendens]|uniref:Uncharacterized protein n=1 Tax=Ameca splendens TaxID=208324 RepID=A0ABV0XK02_9TELE